MNVVELMNAAKVAEELSRSRHKQIRLVLTPSGVLLDGELYRADGIVMDRYRTELDWALIEGDPAVIETQMRKLDSTIVADWRNEAPPKEP